MVRKYKETTSGFEYGIQYLLTKASQYLSTIYLTSLRQDLEDKAFAPKSGRRVLERKPNNKKGTTNRLT